MLIPAVTDFRQYITMLECIAPEHAKAIAMVEAEVAEEVRSEVASGADTVENYVSRLSEEFFDAMKSLDDKFGGQKFSLLRSDMRKSIEGLSDAVGNGDKDPASLKFYLDKITDMRNGVYDPSNARYGAGSDSIAEVHGILSGLNSAIADFETYVKSVTPVEEPGVTAAKPKAVHTKQNATDADSDAVSIEKTFKAETEAHKNMNDRCLILMFKNKTPAIIRVVCNRIEKATEKVLGVPFGEESPVECSKMVLDDGCLYEIVAIDSTDSETINSLKAEISAALSPRFIENTEIFCPVIDIDTNRTLNNHVIREQITGKNKMDITVGKYALNYSWILNALGSKDSKFDSQMGALAAQTGIPSYHGKSYITQLAKKVAETANDTSMKELLAITPKVISGWFPRNDAFTEFVAGKIAPQLRNYVRNVIEDSTGRSKTSYGERNMKDGSGFVSSSIWSDASRPLGASLNTPITDFKSRF